MILFCSANILSGAFFSYCGWAIVGWIIFWFILPETRGRSLEEMEQLFSRPWSCSVYGRDSKEAAADPALQTDAKVVQYVQIRGLNRDCHESEDDDY